MKDGAEPRARSVRVIHKPCRGKPGARFTVSSEHRRQKDRTDNLQILSLLVNGNSADIRTGYVYRCDVDFDPTVDPVEAVEEAYLAPDGPDHLRKTYHQTKESFTAPLLAFQRPTGRFDEPALFAAAEARLRLFSGRVAKAFDARNLPLSEEPRQAVNEVNLRADNIAYLKTHWFKLVGAERDSRNSFNGIMTRDTYTKAASLAALKAMVPTGKMNRAEFAGG